MKIFIFLLSIFLAVSSCKQADKEVIPEKKIELNEADYVVSNQFEKGDVRRYGLMPDSIVNPKIIENILNLAESGLPLTFPQGFYKTDLIFKGRQHIKIYSQDASFSGQIQIIENEKGQTSNRITFKGKLTTYSKFFMRKSQDIIIDTLIVASDTLKSKYGKRSLGCSIYAGSKNVHIKKLVVEDLGSGDDYYQYSLAALQLHGWNNNPQSVIIDEAVIEKSDRHGVYITGRNHQIKNLTIKQVGLGTISHHNGLEDAAAEEIAVTSALWINKCHDSRFTNVTIDCTDSKPQVTVNFDEGGSSEPTIIDYLTIKNNSGNIQLLPNDLTNVVVRHFKDIK